MVHWKDVPEIWQSLYGLTTYALVRLAMLHEISESVAQNLIKMSDLGILMGGRLCEEDLQEAISALVNQYNAIKSNRKGPTPISDTTPICTELSSASGETEVTFPHYLRTNHLSSLVPVVTSPSLPVFYSDNLLKSEPALLRDCMEDWPAMEKWQSLDYIRRVCGLRSVPIETGEHYLSEDAAQQIMTINEFIDAYICKGRESQSLDHTAESKSSIGRKRPHSNTTADGHSDEGDVAQSHRKVGYLAQHQLLKQIPQLTKDIIMPDYCALLTPEEEEEEDSGGSDNGVTINAWFGPLNTVSPLHHDPYHNLLCQVRGHKYVRLYAASQSDCLYPLEGKLNNNSAIDLTASDCDIRKCYPLHDQAPFMETIISPGEMLFIPRHCWHFIAALDDRTAAAWKSARLLRIAESQQRTVSANPHLQKIKLPEQQNRNTYSFSVNIWWGKRIEL
jgi:lysine-specific demethylase 8